MANQIDFEPGDMSRAELLQFLKSAGIRGWSDTNLNNKLQQFCDDYDLPYSALFENPEIEKPKIHIKNEWKELLLTLILTYKDDPFLIPAFDLQKKASTERIMDYYATLIERVERTFPDDLRYDVMNSSPYIAMIDEHTAMTKVMGKISELAAAVASVSSQARIHLWEEIYSTVDWLVFKAYAIEHDLKQNRERDMEECLQQGAANLYQEHPELFDPHSKLTYEEKQAIADKSYSFNLMMIKKVALDKHDVYSRDIYNISKFLALKLRERLNAELNTKNIRQDSYGRLYDTDAARDGITEHVQVIQSMIEANVEGKKTINAMLKRQGLPSLDKIAVKKIQSLQAELDKHIQNIKQSYDHITTMEKVANEKLQAMAEGKIDPDEEYDASFYQKFLQYLQKVKQKAVQYDKVTKPLIEKPVVQAVYNLKDSQ